MGLHNEITADVQEAFNSDLSDATKSIIIKQFIKQYDPVTGQTTEIVSQETTRGIVTNFSTFELFNSAIKPTDLRIIILQDEITFVPAIDDTLVIENEEYKVITVKEDPAKVTYEIQCRK